MAVEEAADSGLAEAGNTGAVESKGGGLDGALDRAFASIDDG